MNMETVIYLKSFVVLFLVVAITFAIFKIVTECQLLRKERGRVKAKSDEIALSQIQRQKEDEISMEPEGVTKPATDKDEATVYLMMPEPNVLVPLQPFYMFKFQTQEFQTTGLMFCSKLLGNFPPIYSQGKERQ